MSGEEKKNDRTERMPKETMSKVVFEDRATSLLEKGVFMFPKKKRTEKRIEFEKRIENCEPKKYGNLLQVLQLLSAGLITDPLPPTV